MIKEEKMENLTISELETALKSRTNPTFEGHLYSEELVEDIGKIFIRRQDPRAEEILRESLESNDKFVKFAAFCALLEAQHKGIKLQEKTSEEMKKIREGKDLGNLFILKCIERKLKAEASLK